MSAREFLRRPRLPAPQVPGGEIALQPPPAVPRAVPGGVLQRLMPAVMVVAMLGMVALMVSTGGMSNPMSLLFPLLMTFSMVGMLAGNAGGKGTRPAEFDEERKDYFRYLAGVREEVADTVRAQRAGLDWHHPDPSALGALVGGRRMWERLAEHDDFCHVRMALGDQRLATALAVPPLGPVEDLEPVSAVAMRRFVHTHSVVPALPTAVSLRGFAAVSLGGEPAAARAAVRAMLLQLCVFHGPDHVRVCLVAPDPDGAEWSWLKWLPHARRDAGPGAGCAAYGSLLDLEESLDTELTGRGRFSRTADPVPGRRHVVIVLDGGHLTGDEHIPAAGGMDGVTLLDLTGGLDELSARRGLRCTISAGRIAGLSPAGPEEFGRADAVTVPQAEAVARALAGHRIGAAAGAAAPAEGAGPGLMAMLGVADPHRLSPATVWRPRVGRERLRVPIGTDPSGLPVELDLKEAAEGGAGPHGLCVGATGSGKSELLRTLVVSLIATHGPDQLNLVLVDFKGGASFLGLDSSPHVAAVITNLEDELAMVDRMRDALAGEMHRRQELLRAAGNFANVGEYEAARAAGAPLDPLPALFIVVDEFSELLSRKPEFAELFVAIGRLGRSLHMHLLLASQRLEEGRLRGLDSHLSYRIGLKTFSGSESRSVLGVPDAYHLPPSPGAGYLKCDSGELTRFDAAYVSGPAPRVQEAARGEVPARRAWAVPFTAAPSPELREPRPEARRQPARPVAPGRGGAGSAEPTLLELVVERLRAADHRAHEVWLPPLDAAPPLDAFDADVPALAAPIGIVDRPFDQRRDAAVLRLDGAGGNCAVVGGPRSGKSTAARTLVMSLARGHAPDDVQVYCLDFGGGALAGLAGLPHVGSVAGRRDGDRVRRTVAELTALLEDREAAFAVRGIASIEQFRAWRRGRGAVAEGSVGDGSVGEGSVGDGSVGDGGEDAPDGRAARFGDVFLVVDGYAAVREDFPALEPQIQALAVRGLSYGLHVVLTAHRWAEIRPALRDMIGSRIELRLGDPADSELDRRAAALVPEGRPGRGLTAEGMHLLLALPRLDGSSDPEDLSDGVADAVERIRRERPGRPAPVVRMLPAALALDELHARCAGGPPLSVPLGIDEAALAPVHVDLAAQPHFVVFADPESGKTTLLRALCRGLIAANPPDRVKLIVADYRRTLLGEVEGGHLAGYATTAERLTAMTAHLCRVLTERLPGPDVTQTQLRERSWWSGPRIVLVVDDYDLVATASGNPLLPLVDFLSQAKDIGFHLIVARRTGGAARAQFDPVLGRLKDLSADGIVMNGNREEGALVGGVRAAPMPPGRGMLVSRARGSRLVQVALAEPRDETPGPAGPEGTAGPATEERPVDSAR